MKIMDGACFFACANKSRTRAAPTPTNISTNSDAVSEKNVAPDSPATARARSVFPHPGGPVSMTPFGTCAPDFLNFSGIRKKSTISASSIFASPMPATSLNMTTSLSSRIFIFDRSCPCFATFFDAPPGFFFASRAASSSALAFAAASNAAPTASCPRRSSRLPITFIPPAFINLPMASSAFPAPPGVAFPPGPPPSSETKNAARRSSFSR
mmetsp:Transcript_8236/g.30075  ORF Transcript_8236/g.30075 Transcript_8236/m.30075 type:complete len:211 (+) Transcript_8236:1491-2123(+)